MFFFTQQERLALISLSCVVLLGSGLHCLFKKIPQVEERVRFIDRAHLQKKMDLNTASFEQLVKIPHIGRKAAERIIRYRRKHGFFQSSEDVINVKGIGPKSYEKIAPFIKVDPPARSNPTRKNKGPFTNIKNFSQNGGGGLL